MKQIGAEQTQSNVWITGLAMFSMFFGAGNIVFPLALGLQAQDQNFYAILGLLITAVGVPFLGLLAMTLFDGNYKYFFNRIGVVPGFLVTFVIMGLIGPFGALPRCIALSFSTLKMYLPIGIATFSFISCIIIYLFTFRKNNIINIIGSILTPFLLLSLIIIIVKGILLSPIPPSSTEAPFSIFLLGLKEGYQTMDLLGAFFFCSVVLSCLKGQDVSEHGERKNYKKMIFLTLKASTIGASLLAMIYIGFSYLAAFNSENLVNVNKDELLGIIAHSVLGPYAGIIVSIAVALACLTTAIALAAVFAEYLQVNVCQNKINYQISLIITLAISFIISTLNFMGIAAILTPILQVCYPALITLCILNICFKLFHFPWIKIPTFIVFAISLIHYFFE